MGQQLRIVHRTGYRYSGLVSASHNEARMTPRSNREQFVLAARVDFTPTAWKHTYTDYWGTRVTAFEITEPHDRLDVVATSTVDIGDRITEGLHISWEEIAEPNLLDEHCEMLQLRSHVEPGEELAVIAAAIAADAGRPSEAVSAVVERILKQVDYVPGSTEVQTRAAEVWSKGAGVCQDIVHLTLGALRSIGIPCRYVSGYMMPSGEPVAGQATVGESHAWMQYWDGLWVGLDPTNDAAPGPFHVEVGVGRDYFDVPPLKGVYAGSQTSEMFVTVEMTALA
ncbi:MAG: transglutaminase family protein [Propionibacteriaceae bacterium]|jgi:transglutaminase-like putative cysteine protease|nr:transglutaminase family protein [Propionibacteriaceae bacterium]